MGQVKKILPVATPPIVSYLHHAYPLSITFTREETLPWFYSNFVQLYYCFQEDYFKMNFFAPENIFPLILATYIDHKLFSRVIKQDIIQFLVDCIDNDIYIYTYLDEYYVPGRKSFGQVHFKHDTFIFGYDLEERYFNIAGFSHYTYNTSTISFDALKTAFLYPGPPDDIHLYQWKNTVYEFDKELLRDYIYDYLHANNTFTRLRIIDSPFKYKHLVWGLRVYDGLVQYIEMLSEKAPGRRDIIPFHVLYEHKKCMRMRLEYIKKEGYLDNIDDILNTYLSFEEKALVFRNLALKCAVAGTNIEKIKNRLLSILQNMKPKEEQVLKLLLQKLS